VYLVGTDPAIAPGALAVSGFLRRTAQLNLQDSVELEVVPALPAADLVVFKVQRIKPVGTGEEHLDSEEQLLPLAVALKDYPVAVDVQFVRSLYDMYLTFTVRRELGSKGLCAGGCGCDQRWPRARRFGTASCDWAERD